jgi:hypothetical protein
VNAAERERLKAAVDAARRRIVEAEPHCDYHDEPMPGCAACLQKKRAAEAKSRIRA